MKIRNIILVLLLALAIIAAGCTDKEEKEDTIEEEDDTDDDDDTSPDEYESLDIYDLVETPYTYNGKLVEVKDAEVTSVKNAYSCLITDGTTDDTITLYGYDEGLVKAGDVLTVRGIFEQYQNKYWEIKIRKDTEDEVIKTDSVTVSYLTIDLGTLLGSPETYYGRSVELKKVTVVNKDSYYNFKLSLDNLTEKLPVYNDGLYLEKFKEGDIITIKGEFMEYNDAPQLKLRNESGFDDGVTDVIDGGGAITYDEHTIAELLADPENFDGDHVKLTEVEVAWAQDDNSASFTLFGVTEDGVNRSLEVVAFDKLSAGDVDKIIPGAVVTVKGEMGYYDQNDNNKNDDD